MAEKNDLEGNYDLVFQAKANLEQLIKNERKVTEDLKNQLEEAKGDSEKLQKMEGEVTYMKELIDKVTAECDSLKAELAQA